MQQCNKTPTRLLNELQRPLGQTVCVKKQVLIVMLAADSTLIDNFPLQSNLVIVE